MIRTTSWEIHTPCEVAVRMLLHINGKFTMRKSKPSLLFLTGLSISKCSLGFETDLAVVVEGGHNGT